LATTLEKCVKGKRTDFGKSGCGIARSLQIIGDWWSLLIVRDAFNGRNILSSRLKKLVDAGIFTVEPDPESALSHLYLLTPKGEQLCVILGALWQWGEDNCFEPGELKYQMVDRAEGMPLARLALTAQDGRKLGPRDYRVEARHG
jgi:DNA-binding HxlR family transcriptional regulator